MATFEKKVIKIYQMIIFSSFQSIFQLRLKISISWTIISLENQILVDIYVFFNNNNNNNNNNKKHVSNFTGRRVLLATRTLVSASINSNLKSLTKKSKPTCTTNKRKKEMNIDNHNIRTQHTVALTIAPVGAETSMR